MNQPERTQPATNRSPQKRAESKDGSDDIERQFLVACHKRCLKRPYGASSNRAWTGIAVKPWHAYALEVSLINAARCKTLEVKVVKHCRQQLDNMAFELRENKHGYPIPMHS